MPSISSVKICNMALAHIGAKSTIESLDEDSAEAQQCKLWYDWARYQTLEDFNWPFAKRRRTLAVHGDVAPSGVWTFRYEYPSDCVKARAIVNPLGEDKDPVPFEVELSDNGEERTILTDMEDAILLFTFDLTNPALFSSRFIDALSWRVAHRIAFSLTGDARIAQNAMQIYNAMLINAAGSAADESAPRTPREASWIEARV
ncbi:MAG: hypothetical protein VW338_09170 [Rhodospirillaceae bacterium]